MRHRSKNRKFHRERGERRALLRSLTVSLIEQEKIETTEARAKSLRPFIEKLITKAKAGDLAGRRLIVARIGPRAARKMATILGPKYKDRRGGYTRIIRLPKRENDGSPMAAIELV